MYPLTLFLFCFFAVVVGAFSQCFVYNGLLESYYRVYQLMEFKGKVAYMVKADRMDDMMPLLAWTSCPEVNLVLKVVLTKCLARCKVLYSGWQHTFVRNWNKAVPGILNSLKVNVM